MYLSGRLLSCRYFLSKEFSLAKIFQAENTECARERLFLIEFSLLYMIQAWNTLAIRSFW